MAFNPFITPVDYVKINGKECPGVSTVRGHGSPREWEEIKSYGAAGSAIRFLGRRLCKFDVICELFEDAHWEQWHAFKPEVLRLPIGKRETWKSIVHPWTDMHGIYRAVVLDVLGPEPTGDRGRHTITIKMQEFRGLKLALAKVEDGPPPEITDPYDLQIIERKERNARVVEQIRAESTKPR